jgi:hypothetical protein
VAISGQSDRSLEGLIDPFGLDRVTVQQFSCGHKLSRQAFLLVFEQVEWNGVS